MVPMKSSAKSSATGLRPLGGTGFSISPIGFGAFKIGRNQKTKYAAPYDLPSDEQVSELLNGLLDLGINYIDTAPAYGTSEERIGPIQAHSGETNAAETAICDNWPRPRVALLPWDAPRTWFTTRELGDVRRREAA